MSLDTKNCPNNSEFLQMMEHFPQMIFWTSAEEDIFLGCNTKFAQFVGLSQPSEIIDHNGFKYFDDDAVILFRQYKSEVIKTGKPLFGSDTIKNKKSGQVAVGLTIAPIFDTEGKITSLICYGTPTLQLSDKSWSAAISLIKKENIAKLLGESNQFIVDTENMGKVALTKREAECALFVLKGITAKEIAEEIFLAPRTVINHIESIKDKIGCNKRSELITALTKGKFIENNF